MKKLLEQKEIILADFDFKKVERAMKSLGWVWIDENQMKYSIAMQYVILKKYIFSSKILKSQIRNHDDYFKYVALIHFFKVSLF